MDIDFKQNLNILLDELYTHIKDNHIDVSYGHSANVIHIIKNFCMDNHVAITLNSKYNNKIIMSIYHNNGTNQNIIISPRLAKLKQIFHEQ